MPATPSITLTANLESILGGAGLAGFMRITLCGFGPVVPSVPSVGMVADAGIPRIVGPQGTGPLTQVLWGNDVIVPAGTFYEIAIMDENRNVIQCGMYQFTGSGTIDLSTAPQIVPPYGFLLSALRYRPCTGAIPGTVYVAAGPVVAVSYNGIFMLPNQASPALSYTVSGTTITLNFSTQAGDRGIDALCISTT